MSLQQTLIALAGVKTTTGLMPCVLPLGQAWSPRFIESRLCHAAPTISAVRSSAERVDLELTLNSIELIALETLPLRWQNYGAFGNRVLTVDHNDKGVYYPAVLAVSGDGKMTVYSRAAADGATSADADPAPPIIDAFVEGIRQAAPLGEELWKITWTVDSRHERHARDVVEDVFLRALEAQIPVVVAQMTIERQLARRVAPAAPVSEERGRAEREWKEKQRAEREAWVAQRAAELEVEKMKREDTRDEATKDWLYALGNNQDADIVAEAERRMIVALEAASAGDEKKGQPAP